ncbi:TAXI family TRAP transporter solute-binding subunit [Roseomonas eburnea]|uniref:TAXI family TRAP transporter solute-binding subunit n=1 Tax=Neoroseomonas eburnea TaxID=1346889 RepID=A0A9X9XK18_9PROT|nr:TAXI family TRAP transporter solute-binding subunit [Neoroseomonas eburnea]MBR0684054.1 TAXI family TRAP transporter solute-binding subunit [Neoroseomonas eburnea]
MTLLIGRRGIARGTLGVALATPFVRTATAQTTLEWVAGSVGGGWYTMAAGLASLIREENPDIQIRVVPGGGLANPTRINNNQSQMGWGIDAFSASAVQGIEPYTAKHEKIRSLGTGYSPTEHHFLRHTGAGPEDMRAILTQRGLKIAAPQRSSTDEMTLQRILRFLGTSPDKIRAEGGRYLNGSYADIAAAYNDGQVDYLYVALAKPAAIMTEIAQGRRGGRMVAFPQDIRDHLTQQYAYAQGILPGGTYPQLMTGDVPVTMMDSVILVHESIPADVVQKITATLIRNKGQRLATIHASMAGWTPEQAVGYRGVPFHPGAAAAFRAVGASPPA